MYDKPDAPDPPPSPGRAKGTPKDDWLALASTALDPFAVIDPQLNVVYTNRGIPGLLPSTAADTHLSDHLGPVQLGELEYSMPRLLPGNSLTMPALGNAAAARPASDYEVHLRGLYRDKQLNGCLLLAHDISAQRNTETRLREERDRIRQYLDIAEVIILLLDNQGRVVLINRKGAELLGRAESLIVGHNWFDHFLPERLKTPVKEVYQQLMEGEIEPVEYYENPIVDAAGQEHLIAWQNTVLRDPAGRISATLSSGEDITDRRAIEKELGLYQEQLEQRVRARTAQLESTNEQLRQAHEERLRMQEQAQEHLTQLAHVGRMNNMAELATTIAHELNQPLAAMTNYARGIQHRLHDTPGLPNDVLHALDQIVSQAERASLVIHRTRDFISNRKVHWQALNLHETVTEALELIQPAVKRQQVRIINHCPKDLPLVVADAVQLEQVLVNLMTNALEALSEVPVEDATIEIKADRRGEDMVQVGLHDNGPGMSKQKMEYIFNPFVTSKSDGMGMGLSISRTIVEAHGGRLWMAARTEGGLSLYFSLPCTSA